MTYALVGLCVLLGSLLAPSLVWLHSGNNENKHLRDLLKSVQDMAGEYKSGRDVEVAAHAVTSKELATEKTLRAIAEAERNEAQRRVRNELVKHMKDATDDEISALTAEMFAPSLSVVPSSDSKPNRRPASDDLIDPSADM